MELTSASSYLAIFISRGSDIFVKARAVKGSGIRFSSVSLRLLARAMRDRARVRKKL
jgi:hypothetical protein